MKKMKKVLTWLLVFSMGFSTVPVSQAEAETTETVINAMDYGADPTGEKDSTEAIQKALAAAKEAEAEGEDVTLEFPKGEYHIYKDKAEKREYHTSNTNSIENPIKTIGFLVEGHENLTIDGNGSLFMMHGNMMAMAIVKSKNVILKELSWDFAVPTVVEMTVTKVEGNFTEYYIPDCFPHTVSGNTIYWSSDLSPYTGQPYWSGSGHEPDGRGTYAVVGYQPADEMARNYYVSDGPLSNVSRIEEIDENNVRVYYGSRSGEQSKNQNPGAVFELCGNAHRETAGAFTWESENVSIEDVNVHFMHGFGWLIQMSKDVYYRRCNLVPRDNSGHTTVSFADGIHASGAAGQLLFEDCNFANTHDDPLNLHGTFTRVESKNDDYTLTLKYIHGQQGGFPQYHPGDQVQFFTRDTLESTDGETMYTVAEVIQDTDESSDKRTMIIRFEEKLPDALSDRISGEPKYVAENVTYAPAVTIRNCTFKNVATRGVLCTTRNKVLIENNIFLNMSMATIYLSNDSNEWYESGPIRDMTIKNNIFYIKDIGRTAWNTAPAIYIHPVTKGGGLPDASNPIHKNITIEGNTFFMDQDRVIEAESVENLKFIGNKVYRMNPEVELEITLNDAEAAVGETTALTVSAEGNTNNGAIDNLFQFKACKNVLIEGNVYDDGLKLCAVADQATKNNGIIVKDQDILLTTSAAAVSDPVRNIQFASANPAVASVDADGKITGISEGTAEVFAYYKWNDTIIRSNAVEVTIGGEAGSFGSGTGQEPTPEVTYELNPAFTIVRENEDTRSYDADSIEIISEAGDLYQQDNTLKNLFLYTPDGDRENLRACVKVEGLPVRESGKWDTASFILFAGEDDYYTIGKKSHYDGFATVKERAQAATEEAGDEAYNAASSAWLGIVKEGDSIRLEYSLDGLAWFTAKTYTDASFGNDYLLGFGSWTSNNTARKAVFSEFKVGTADQSYAELSAVEIMTVSEDTETVPDEPDVFVKFGTDVVFTGNGKEKITVNIPAELNKTEMTYAFGDDVTITKNEVSLSGNFGKEGSVVLDVSEGDVIVIASGEKDYTFTINCVESNITTVEKIKAGALNFDAVPTEEKAFFMGVTSKEKGTIEVTADENVGTVEILSGVLREKLEVERNGNVYAADYTLSDGLNSFYVKSVAKDGASTKRYVLNVVYDVPDAPEVKLSNTTAADLKEGALVADLFVVGVEDEASYMFELCAGYGDEHNDYFEIAGSQLKVKKVLKDGEVYRIRVKALNGEEVLENSFAIQAKDPAKQPDYAGNDLPTAGMKLTTGTLETTEGSLEALFDGNPDTFYHSNWSGTKPAADDFWIIIELPETREVTGLRYLPRQSSPNGRILAYEISYSEDGQNWSEPVSGTWSDNAEWKMASFDDNVTAKFVKLFATDSKADNSGRHMTGAELRLTFVEEEIPETPAPEVTETPQPTETPEEKDDVTTVFDDVYNDWYTEYVQYVYDNQLMTGIKGTRHFAPFENISKAQVAQVLYNMEGQPEVDLGSAKAFKELRDVYDAEWYAPAVAWAYETGVVTGDLNAKKFSPDADVTREQLALMIYRYAKHKGYDVSASTDFAGLANADKVADWSMDGMKWAVGEGLISGAEVNGVKDLDPQGNAQRAQVAAILQRFRLTELLFEDKI